VHKSLEMEYYLVTAKAHLVDDLSALEPARLLRGGDDAAALARSA